MKEKSAHDTACTEENEISILDLFIALLRHKWMIFFIVLCAGVISVVYSLAATSLYRSYSTIVPYDVITVQAGIGGAQSFDQFNFVLRSRKFTKNLIERHSLMPVIFSENWDKDRKSWKNGFDPTFQQTYEALQSMLEVSFNGSAMTLAFTFTDPAEAQKILTFYLADLNEFMRRQFLEDVQVRRQSLEKQLNSASDPVLKDKLSEMIIQYIQKEDLAKVKDFYGFEIIDAPFVPENRFKPERSRICMISVIAAFFAAVIIAFILEYIAYLKKNEDPKKIAELKRCIKFRSR